MDSAGLQAKRIYDFQRLDEELRDIIHYLDHDLLPSDNGRAKRILIPEDVYFLDENSIVYHLDANQRKGYKENHAQLVLPHPLRYEALVSSHDSLQGEHLGVHKTYEKL